MTIGLKETWYGPLEEEEGIAPSDSMSIRCRLNVGPALEDGMPSCSDGDLSRSSASSSTNSSDSVGVKAPLSKLSVSSPESITSIGIAPSGPVPLSPEGPPEPFAACTFGDAGGCTATDNTEAALGLGGRKWG